MSNIRHASTQNVKFALCFSYFSSRQEKQTIHAIKSNTSKQYLKTLRRSTIYIQANICQKSFYTVLILNYPKS